MKGIVSAEECPPRDQPWLLSSVGDLREEAAERRELVALWTSFDFPGRAGAFKDKLCWSDDLVKDSQQNRTFDDPHEVICGDILFRCAPPTLELQILLPRHCVKSALTRLDKASRLKLLAAPEVRQPPTKELLHNFDDYVAWLGEAPAATAVEAGMAEVFGQMSGAEIPPNWPLAAAGEAVLPIIFCGQKKCRRFSWGRELPAMPGQSTNQPRAKRGRGPQMVLSVVGTVGASPPKFQNQNLGTAS
jgi:hypothetical protein